MAFLGLYSKSEKDRAFASVNSLVDMGILNSDRARKVNLKINESDSRVLKLLFEYEYTIFSARNSLKKNEELGDYTNDKLRLFITKLDLLF
jgi:hypothetical protein